MRRPAVSLARAISNKGRPDINRSLLGTCAATFGFQIYEIETEFLHAD
jgi:hypothetical protein